MLYRLLIALRYFNEWRVLRRSGPHRWAVDVISMRHRLPLR